MITQLFMLHSSEPGWAILNISVNTIEYLSKELKGKLHDRTPLPRVETARWDTCF